MNLQYFRNCFLKYPILTELIYRDTDFSIAFNAVLSDNSSYDISQFPAYFTVEFNQHSVNKCKFTMIWIKSGFYSLIIATGITTKTPISLVRWGDTFKYRNQTEAKNLGIDTYFCPESRELSVLGNAFSDTYRYFEININRWNSSTSSVTCESDPNIDAVIKKMEVGIYLVNSYFDSDDYNSPVNTYIDDRFFYNLVPQYTKSSLIYIQ